MKLNQGETARNCPNILFDVNDATDPQARRYRIAEAPIPGHKLQDQLGTCPAFLKIHKAWTRSYEKKPRVLPRRLITTNEN